MPHDDRLMIRLQEGDAAAFDELVSRHQGSLLGFFLKHTRDRQQAEDLTQETLLRIYSRAWDYLPTGRFLAWMYRIARNLMIDQFRRQSHDALIRAVDSSAAADDRPLLDQIAAEIAPAGEQADFRELAALVDELLSEIPEEQRTTFLLHHLAGLPLTEVADVMESHLATTKSRLRLAREKLRQKLHCRGVTAPP